MTNNGQTPGGNTTTAGAVEMALEKAIGWFEEYANNHTAKGTEDGRKKAVTNQLRAAELRAALTSSALSGDDLAKGLRTSQKALDEIARQEQANIAGYLALRDFPIGSASTEGEGE